MRTGTATTPAWGASSSHSFGDRCVYRFSGVWRNVNVSGVRLHIFLGKRFVGRYVIRQVVLLSTGFSSANALTGANCWGSSATPLSANSVGDGASVVLTLPYSASLSSFSSVCCGRDMTSSLFASSAVFGSSSGTGALSGSAAAGVLSAGPVLLLQLAQRHARRLSE